MSPKGESVFANLTQEWQALVTVMNKLLGLTNGDDKWTPMK